MGEFGAHQFEDDPRGDEPGQEEDFGAEGGEGRRVVWGAILAP